MIRPGTLLYQRYQIVRLIGRGGMGAVYEATDTRLRCTVALKHMLVGHEPDFVKAFEREAQLLAGLRHPALPVVSDYFFDEDGYFLVMQFIPGDNLAARLAEQHAPFAIDMLLDAADLLLDALHYLHTQNPPIIHRDIKPQNLKITPRGEIVLLDFGLAKGVAEHNTRSASYNSLFGYTLQYSLIEQIQGVGTDERSDLYALAATIQHLITGTLPTNALERTTRSPAIPTTSGTSPSHLTTRSRPRRPKTTPYGCGVSAMAPYFARSEVTLAMSGASPSRPTASCSPRHRRTLLYGCGA
jgi:eukaryotic-like serine/threonine-protein kinase